MAHVFHLLFGGFLWVVTALFMVGITGTVLVLIITSWEDMKTIAGYDEKTPAKRFSPALKPQTSR